MKHKRYNGRPNFSGVLVGNIPTRNGRWLDVYAEGSNLWIRSDEHNEWIMYAEQAKEMIESGDNGTLIGLGDTEWRREVADAMIAFWEKNHGKFGH